MGIQCTLKIVLCAMPLVSTQLVLLQRKAEMLDSSSKIQQVNLSLGGDEFAVNETQIIGADAMAVNQTMALNETEVNETQVVAANGTKFEVSGFAANPAVPVGLPAVQDTDFEMRDGSGEWQRVAIAAKNEDGTYRVAFPDGVLWSRVSPNELHRTVSSIDVDQALAAAAANANATQSALNAAALNATLATVTGTPDADPSIAAALGSVNVTPEYVVGIGNACPYGYRGIGDERSCKQATFALKLGRWKMKSSFLDHPGGCFRNPSGDVYLNNHTGAAKTGHAPVCERDFAVAARGQLESRDADGRWWSVTVAAKNVDGTYNVYLDDGTFWAGVLGYNIRRRLQVLVSDTKLKADSASPVCTINASQGSFVQGCDGANSCPPGYKGVGDERSCKQAMLALGLGRWGRKASWGMYPAGCFRNPTGDVYVNNHTGWAKSGYAPICEEDFKAGAKAGEFEARAVDGNYVSVTIEVKNDDGSYEIVLGDGTSTHWASTSPYNLRRTASSLNHLLSSANVSAFTASSAAQTTHFLAGSDAENGCPLGYKGIGDERSCKEALRALGLGPWGKKAAWSIYPAGCFSTPDGQVSLNNHTGAGKEGYASLCEKDFAHGVANTFEARDADGKWWPVVISGRSEEDGTYNVSLDGGIQGSGVFEYDLRRMDLGHYVFGANGSNACPPNYKGIGDKRTCQAAMAVLSVGPFRRKDAWGVYPGGCFAASDGDVYLNTHAGWGRADHAPICEKEFAVGMKGIVEARVNESDIDYQPVMVATRLRDGTYSVVTQDGTRKSGLSQYQIRGIVASSKVNASAKSASNVNSSQTGTFILGEDGLNNCPVGYRRVGDEPGCKKAMEELGIGPWGRKDVWADHPGGCFRNPDGDVYFNIDENGGAKKEDRAPICHKIMLETTKAKPVSAVAGNKTAANVSKTVRAGNVSKTVRAGNTTVRANVENLRTSDGEFALGMNGQNSCPAGFKAIGDEGSCKKAFRALNLGPWAQKVKLSDFPAGCHRRPSGDVYLNNHTGSSREGNAPICEKDFQPGVSGVFESRDASGQWKPVTIDAKAEDHTYDILFADGATRSGVDERSIRRMVAAASNVSHTTAATVSVTAASEVDQDNAGGAAESESSTVADSLEAEGNFELGEDGDNACPDGYVALADGEACQQAMDALGLGPWGRTDTWEDHPGGCFRNPGGDVYFNVGAGQGKSERASICKKAEEVSTELMASESSDKELESDQTDGKAASESIKKKSHGAQAAKKTQHAQTEKEEHKTQHSKIEEQHHEEALMDFALGAERTNACPENYKGIGDERTCKKAMKALGLPRWGRKASWGDFPAGCHRRTSGGVFLNNNTGSGREGSAPICEKDVDLNAANLYETLDASKQWWPITVASRADDGLYTVSLDDGSQISEISPFNLRRKNQQKHPLDTELSAQASSKKQKRHSSKPEAVVDASVDHTRTSGAHHQKKAHHQKAHRSMKKHNGDA